MGLAPNRSAFESCTIFHRMSPSGQAGLPSYSTGVTFDSSALTRKFHIIQPVVVKKNMRSPGMHVEVEGQMLQLLDQDAAMAVA